MVGGAALGLLYDASIPLMVVFIVVAQGLATAALRLVGSGDAMP